MEAQIKAYLSEQGYENITIRCTDFHSGTYAVYGRKAGKKETHVLAKGTENQLMQKLQLKVKSDNAFFAVV